MEQENNMSDSVVITRPSVVIESPYAPTDRYTVHDHLVYLRECIFHSLSLGEAPFASHGFYTHYLDDTIPGERQQGIECGYAWMLNADHVAIYTDMGVSKGMQAALKLALESNIPVEFRSIR
jgi:hypothetical protein